MLEKKNAPSRNNYKAFFEKPKKNLILLGNQRSLVSSAIIVEKLGTCLTSVPN